ncbi:MAG TPA: hypothetical protein VGC91_00320 [Pyrinomonadaceae bacterium]|jgi:hypothetical protein
MDEIELTELSIRTAIMSKDELLGIIGLAVAEQFAQVGRFDPRTGEPHTSRWNSRREARRGFRNMLEASRENGWDVLYDGPPLVG